MQPDSPDYHPASPDSPLASSLHRATNTIDDLTLALTNFSRVPSPEPQNQISCCCGSETCEATKSWLALKSKLESRLILSAEVGSALLQRHEAYVRRHEVGLTCALHDATPYPASSTLPKATCDSVQGNPETIQAGVDARATELLEGNAALEKRLVQALLNSEVTEASNKALLQELDDAREQISKLSAHHARTVGLSARLSTALQDNEDIQQERDSQAQRAKLAEARLVTFKNRIDKLQAEVRRLQDDLEARGFQRLESSDSLLQDVRSRLKHLQLSYVSRSAANEDHEVIKVVESLVADNEMLKVDNKRLHELLAESREDLQVLQRVMGEQSTVPPIRVETPSRHSHVSSVPSSFAKDSPFNPTTRRPSSVESRPRCAYEPLTPETGHRPLSPADSLIASGTKYTTFVHPQPRYPPSHLSLDLDDGPEYDQLFRSNQATKAVQTDRWLGFHGISQTPSLFMDRASMSPHDVHSDSSSILDGTGSPMSSLLERLHYLLLRMTQADVLTLTNRLKRQHLRGADVKHLSRTTIGNILSDVSHLRAQHRAWLEDDKITTLCTRKDLRALFKLFKEALEEMGQMRVTLNDVVLDPTIAGKISEMALDPVKAQAMQKERKVIGTSASWMAPISRLFSSAPQDPSSLPSTASMLLRSTSRGRENTRVSRPAPKIGPALAASATIVNVEFSGTSAGKSVTSIFSAHPNDEGTHSHLPNLHPLPHPAPSAQNSVRSVMGIFAGAPHIDDVSEPWVVLPRAPRRVQSAYLMAEPPETDSATLGGPADRKRKPSQVSRNVDAILDTPTVSRSAEDWEADDIPGPLSERALRRRGLSDTSIHSTFMNQGGARNESSAHPGEQAEPWLERASVLRTLSRTVQSFKQAASDTISSVAHTSTSVPSQASIPESAPRSSHSYPSLSRHHLNIPHSPLPRASSPTLASLIPSLASLAATGVTFDSTYSHGLREDASIPRLFGREVQGRDI